MKTAARIGNLLSMSAPLLFAYCNLQPAGPSAEDLFGTWMMSEAVLTSTVTVHTDGADSDSVDAHDTTINFTNSNDYYTYYSAMTYYSQFDDNILGNTAMIADTGTWTLSGTTLTIVSSQSQTTYTAVLDLQGNSSTTTTRVFSDSQPGPNAGDYVLYHQDLAITAARQ